MLIVGLAQMNIAWEDKIKNHEKIEFFFMRRKQDVKFIIFPKWRLLDLQ